jgi:hypothetical protein
MKMMNMRMMNIMKMMTDTSLAYNRRVSAVRTFIEALETSEGKADAGCRTSTVPSDAVKRRVDACSDWDTWALLEPKRYGFVN